MHVKSVILKMLSLYILVGEGFGVVPGDCFRLSSNNQYGGEIYWAIKKPQTCKVGSSINPLAVMTERSSSFRIRSIFITQKHYFRIIIFTLLNRRRTIFSFEYYFFRKEIYFLFTALCD